MVLPRQQMAGIRIRACGYGHRGKLVNSAGVYNAACVNRPPAGDHPCAEVPKPHGEGLDWFQGADGFNRGGSRKIAIACYLNHLSRHFQPLAMA